MEGQRDKEMGDSPMLPMEFEPTPLWADHIPLHHPFRDEEDLM